MSRTDSTLWWSGESIHASSLLVKIPGITFFRRKKKNVNTHTHGTDERNSVDICSFYHGLKMTLIEFEITIHHLIPKKSYVELFPKLSYILPCYIYENTSLLDMINHLD